MGRSKDCSSVCVCEADGRDSGQGETGVASTNADQCVARMRALSDQGRLGHAYIVTGEDADVVSDAVRRIGGSLLCARPTPDGEACNACAECLRVQSDNHPGLTNLTPDGASLKLAQFRVAKRADARMLSGSTWHIVALYSADRLTVEAANSILKWMEEPHPGRLFLLATTAPSALLPTIRSRCFTIRLHGADRDEDRATKRSEVSSAVDAAVLELTAAIAERPDTAWHLAAEKLAKMDFGAEEWLHFAERWMACSRDIAAVASGLPPAAFAADGERLRELGTAITVPRAVEMAARAAGLRRRLTSHVNPVSALEAVLLGDL